MKTELQLTVKGKQYTYILEKKKIKNYNLRVKSDGTVYLSAPRHATQKTVEDVLRRHITFIDRARERVAARRADAAPLQLVSGDTLPIWGAPHTVCVTKGSHAEARAEDGILYLTVRDPKSAAERQRCFAAFLDREARTGLTPRTAAFLPLFAPNPTEMPTLTFRTMKSKWGVCRPGAGRITLSRNLVYLPLPLADYVICHELAHFRHPDHSAAFWQHLSLVMPDCKERRRALNAFSLPVFENIE